MNHKVPYLIFRALRMIFLLGGIRKRNVCSMSFNSASNMYTHEMYKIEFHAV